MYDALFSLPRAGVVGAQLSYADGSFQHSAFGFPGLRQLIVELFPLPGRFYESRFSGVIARTGSGGRSFPVDHTLGATMMLRAEVIAQTACSTSSSSCTARIDWSIRIRRTGWAIYCVPKAHVIHLAGQSTGQVRPRRGQPVAQRLLLFDKHDPPLKRAVARQIIRLGMRRKITETRRAFAAGQLSAAERDALIDAYRTVQTL